MAQNKDLYGILGVSRTATPDEIKKAYRVASMKHHPDRNGGSAESKTKFQEINDANRILSDEALRRVFDKGGYQAVLDHEAGGNVGSTAQSASEKSTAERQRKRYSEEQVWDFFGREGKPAQPQAPRPAAEQPTQSSSSGNVADDINERRRLRREQQAKAMAGSALTQTFNTAGQQAASAASELRGATASPESMTEEARMALESAYAKARELVREMESWKAKFKR